MELLDIANENLALAQDALHELPALSVGDAEVRQRLLWIEHQLNQLIGSLQAISADLEAGCSVTEMGYLNQDELVDILEVMASQIANLKAMTRMLKLIER